MEFKLLGKSNFTPPTSPEEAVLEVWPNHQTERNYLIEFNSEDFTSLCPITGQPDFAQIHISYIPDQLCIETKSLKYYLHSFRNYEGFNEKVITTIMEDLVKACQPKKLRVVGKFAARGGIRLTTTAQYPDLDPSELF